MNRTTQEIYRRAEAMTTHYDDALRRGFITQKNYAAAIGELAQWEREAMKKANDEKRAPSCSICGGPVEPWPGGKGYGHNPWPARPNIEDRCCDWCNNAVVIPVRLKRGFARLEGA